MKHTRTHDTIVAILVAGVLLGCGKREGAPLPAASAAGNGTNQRASALAANPGFAKLGGKWQRPDGGYIIEIRSVGPGGKLDAGYFNPRSIHVANAEAVEDGGSVKVFIELRDQNYPGAAYRLTYQPELDQLVGLYHQPLVGQTFEVAFHRLQP